MPWAMIWSTLAVIVAESDLPSKMKTSAPYFSLAYFLASVAWPWWKTLVRSDTKKAIFFGVLVAGLNSPAAAAGAGLVGSTTGALVGSAAGAWVAGAGAAPPPQAASRRLASTTTANRVNRFFFMLRFLLIA